VRQELGNYEGAAADCEKALKLDGGDKEAILLRSVLYMKMAMPERDNGI